jgi:hypothetical protein
MWTDVVFPCYSHDRRRRDGYYPDCQTIFDKYGFEMIISMTLITERAIDCVMAISYDKSDPEDTKKGRLTATKSCFRPT